MSFTDQAFAGPAFTITELIVPESVDATDATDFIGMAEVRSTVEAEQRGISGAVYAAAEMPPD